MVLSYTPESKVNQDMIMAGFLHSSLIYESNEDEIIENMEVQVTSGCVMILRQTPR